MSVGNEPIYEQSFDKLHQSLMKRSKGLLTWEAIRYPNATHMSVLSKSFHEG